MLTITTDDKGGFAKLIGLRPGSASNEAGYLAAQAKIHERMRWTNLRVEYVGAVGTTEGGVVLLGVDWLNSLATIDLKHIVGLSPNKQCAAWDRMSMPVPVSMMRGQTWLSTRSDSEASHGGLAIFVSGAKVSSSIGYIRITYSVAFGGTLLP